jgi:hypothetical protein
VSPRAPHRSTSTHPELFEFDFHLQQRRLRTSAAEDKLVRIIVSALCLWLLGACGEDSHEPSESDVGASDSGPRDGEAGAPASEDAREVPCTDNSISQLMLFDVPATGRIQEEAGSGGGFQHHIDTSAGGLTPKESFVYGRFSEAGLDKVAMTDEEAFESTRWDIAFRRYVIRLNSGVSGPGTVTGARTAPGTEFATLREVPEGLMYRTEAYFTDNCEYVPDTSGIGAPAAALSSFWSYQSCVQMTGNIYVIALPEERHVKLEVLSYYTPENQRTCDQTGQVPMPSGAGNLRIRWAFLE